MLFRLASAASLTGLDSLWRTAVHDSLVVKVLSFPRALAGKLVSHNAGAASLGDRLQQLSYILAVVLFAILALPQFANDKEGLALVSLAGLALWLSGYLLGGRESRRTGAVDSLVLLYFAVGVVSTFASHYVSESIRGLAKESIYIATYFYLTAVLRKSERRKTILVSVLLFTAVLVSVYGFKQYVEGVRPLATWEDPTVESKGTRIFSTLGNPNLLAGYLVPMVPLSLSLFLSGLFARKPLHFLPPLIAAAILAAAAVLTGSRGGYIGLLVGCLAILSVAACKFIKERPGTRPYVIAFCLAAPLLLAVGLHFVPSFEQRVTSIFAFREHSSNAFRMNVWESSLRMFKDSWWIGVGPGNQAFRLAYGLYMESGFDALGTYCVPLEIAVESGIVALLAFALLLASLFGRAHLSFWSQKQSVEKWLTAGAVAAIAGLMAHGLVDTVFYRPQVQFIFWLAVALVVTDESD